ncbi:MAG: hypothetical protein WC438_05915 [Candidatus Pacearchaeota archaeon]
MDHQTYKDVLQLMFKYKRQRNTLLREVSNIIFTQGESADSLEYEYNKIMREIEHDEEK